MSEATHYNSKGANVTELLDKAVFLLSKAKFEDPDDHIIATEIVLEYYRKSKICRPKVEEKENANL